MMCLGVSWCVCVCVCGWNPWLKSFSHYFLKFVFSPESFILASFSLPSGTMMRHEYYIKVTQVPEVLFISSLTLFSLCFLAWITSIVLSSNSLTCLLYPPFCHWVHPLHFLPCILYFSALKFPFGSSQHRSGVGSQYCQLGVNVIHWKGWKI